MGKSDLRFQVDSRLATLLSQEYSSSEKALKELIDNAWDADAETVSVTLPRPMSDDPIVIKDDGSGMTEEELRRHYLSIASDRRSRRGERTASKNRLVPWGHNLVLLSKLKYRELRLAYAQRALEHGWSRNVLNIHIETRLLEREGKAVTNFAERLPAPDSDLAHQTLKDPYLFAFLRLGKEADEREIEIAIEDSEAAALAYLETMAS